MLLFQTHLLSISPNRDSPVSRRNLESIPCSKEGHDRHPAIVQESPKSSELSTIYGGKELIYSDICTLTTEFSFSYTWFEPDLDQHNVWGHEGALLTLILGYCGLPVSPQSWIHHNQTHP